MTIDAPADLTTEHAARWLFDRAKGRPEQTLVEIDQWLQSDDPAEVLAARWARGAALYELGRNDEALVDLQAALDDGRGQLNGWVEISLAAAEGAAGRPQDAMERLQALMSGEREDVGVLAGAQLGMILLHQGKARDGLVMSDQSIERLRRLPDLRSGLARALGNAGHCCLILGEIRAAERYFNEAMPVAAETDQIFMVGGLHQNLAYVRMCVGDLPGAIALYRQAINFYHEAGRPARGMVSVYDDLAEAYRFAGLPRDAVRFARLSVWTARQHSNVEGHADSLYRYAHCLFDHGSFEAATTAADRATELFGEGGRELWAVRARLVATAAAIAVDGPQDAPEAAAATLTSIALRLDELGSTAEATRARNMAAQLLIDNKCDDAARAVLESRSGERTAGNTDHTIDMLERLFGDALMAWVNGKSLCPVLAEAQTRLGQLMQGLADAELRNGVVSLSARFRSLALDDVLSDQPDPWAVLAVEESWRFTQRAAHGTVVSGGEDDEISERLGLLRLLYRQRRRKDTLDDDLEKRIKELEADIRELSMSASTDGGSVTLDSVETEADLSAILTDWLDSSGGMLVQVFEHRGQVHAVSVSSGAASYRVASTTELVEQQLSGIRSSIGRLLRSQSSSPTAGILWQAIQSDGRNLGALLLGPVSAGQEVVVSCPAGFAPLPWSLMADDSCVISVIAGASTWSPPPRIPVSDVAVVVGPELEQAGEDGRAVVAAIPTATIVTGDLAGCEGLRDALQQNSVVHVAAHSHFRPDNVMFSSLQMSDGLVPVYELARLERSAHLVVLAACEAGGTGGGEFGGWLGLVPELLRAGAECLVAPIRPIADTDAAVVMARFYRYLPENSVAATLAKVRASLRDESPRLQAAGHAFLAFGRGHAVLGV